MHPIAFVAGWYNGEWYDLARQSGVDGGDLAAEITGIGWCCRQDRVDDDAVSAARFQITDQSAQVGGGFVR